MMAVLTLLPSLSITSSQGGIPTAVLIEMRNNVIEGELRRFGV